MARPVKHVLLLKFKDEVSQERKQELIDGYAALPSKIETMKAFEWGTDVSVENLHGGFTHCFITTFDSAEGRDAYLVHQKHTEYGAELFSSIEKVLVVDFVPTVVLSPVQSS